MSGQSKAGIQFQERLTKTGKCPRCGTSIENHPQCPSCGILCGKGHLNNLMDFREHQICTYCIQLWKKLDKLVDRETTFEELRQPERLFIFPRNGEVFHPR